MDQVGFLRLLSTVMANIVWKDSIINGYGGGFLPIFSLLLPGRTYFSAKLSTGPAFIVMYWDCKYFYGPGGK